MAIRLGPILVAASLLATGIPACLDVEVPPCPADACPQEITPPPAEASAAAGGGGAPPPEPTTAVPPSPPSLPPPPTPPLPESLLIRWQNCTGVVGSFEAPRGQVDAVVPASFAVRGASLLTAALLFEAVLCARASSDHRVIERTGFFHLLVRVRPLNETWSAEVPSFFVVDLLETGAPGDPSLVSELGLSVRQVVLNRSDPSLLGQGEAHAWRYRGPGDAIDVEFLSRGGRANGDEGLVHYWHQTPGGLLRIDNEKGYEYDDVVIEGGLLRLESKGPGAAVLPGGCCTAWAGQAYGFDAETWVRSKQVFPSA